MTNEELVMKIREGSTDLYSVLWEQVHDYIASMALRRLRSVTKDSEADADDLIQSGYIALTEAVKAYDPETGYNFLTFLTYHLKTAFNETCGVRTKRKACDPIHRAASLDVPVDPDDPDGETRGDLIPAPGDTEQTIVDKVYRERLRDAEERLLSRLSESAADVIRSKFFDNEPVERTAERYNLSVAGLSARRTNYMTRLRVLARSTPEGKELQRYIDEQTDFYMQVGPQRFMRTHTSAPEYLTMLRDDLAKKYGVSQ